MKTNLICVLLMLFSSLGFAASKKTTFEIKDGHFYRNGEVVSIHAGEMHYARIPHQYWRHRLQMMKGMGLNTVATYVFWNLHETEPGKWDFSGDKNLAEYIRIAGEEGMMVILRPGPYVCAEWEYGGYPWWLQNIPGMEIRRDNPAFLERTKAYIERLYQEVGDLQCTKGGPIVMVQCENEFGSYVAQRKDIPLEEHRAYNAKIKQQLADAGFNVPLFTSDGSWLFEGGTTEGALPTANGESDIENLKKVVDQYHGGKGPYMVAEFYPGWLSHWAEPFPQVSASEIARQTEAYLKNDVSFNFYMVHGGTNFGFTSGANYDKKRDIQPDMTSYDYDAPISEAGWVTPKYDSIRNVMKRYVKYAIPDAPAPNPVIEIPSIKLTKVADVLALTESTTPVTNNDPQTFEQLNQGYGYVLYTRHFNQPISGTLEIPGLRDYAVVYVDGEKVGVLNRNTQTYSMEIDVPFNATLEILVENMGRINYGSEIVQMEHVSPAHERSSRFADVEEKCVHNRFCPSQQIERLSGYLRRNFHARPNRRHLHRHGSMGKRNYLHQRNQHRSLLAGRSSANTLHSRCLVEERRKQNHDFRTTERNRSVGSQHSETACIDEAEVTKQNG